VRRPIFKTIKTYYDAVIFMLRDRGNGANYNRRLPVKATFAQLENRIPEPRMGLILKPWEREYDEGEK